MNNEIKKIAEKTVTTLFNMMINHGYDCNPDDMEEIIYATLDEISNNGTDPVIVSAITNWVNNNK